VSHRQVGAQVSRYYLDCELPIEAACSANVTFSRICFSRVTFGPRPSQRCREVITPIGKYHTFDLLLGVSVDSGGLPTAFRSKSLGVIGIKNRGFEIVGLSEGSVNEDALSELVLDTFANVAEAYDLES
jgi:hypothetical protein